jgi:hypothetical protein
MHGAAGCRYVNKTRRFSAAYINRSSTYIIYAY